MIEADEYTEVIILFSLLWYLYDIFQNKNCQKKIIKNTQFSYVFPY